MPPKLTQQQIQQKLFDKGLKLLDEYQGMHKKYNIKCLKCGEQYSSRINDVIYKNVKKCACKGSRTSKHYKLLKMQKSGKKIGNLTVIKYCGTNNIGRGIWMFRCDCGKEVKYCIGDVLRWGKRGYTSCGCSQFKQGKEHGAWKGYKDIPASHWSSLKYGAIQRGIDVEITIEDVWNQYIKQNKKCALSGRSIIFGSKYKMECTASIDRIDSLKGYTKDNIQIIHKHINKMKNIFDQDYFILTCKEIAKNN